MFSQCEKATSTSPVAHEQVLLLCQESFLCCTMQKWHKSARRGSGILESQNGRKEVLEEKGEAIEGHIAQGAGQLGCVFGEKLSERRGRNQDVLCWQSKQKDLRVGEVDN